MESPAFGWAVGDMIAIIKTIHSLLCLFRGARGAKDHFTTNAAWLESFARDLQRIHDFMDQSSNESCKLGLQEKLLLISSGYTQFEQYLDRFDIFLPQPISVEGVCSKRWRMVKMVKKSVQWSWKDLNRHLDDLKLAVSMPLAEMNLILLLDLCSDLQGMNQRVESLPTASDLSEIKTLVEGQRKNIEELAKTGDEIIGAFRENTKTFAVESTVEHEAWVAESRLQARLASIAGHLKAYATGVELLLSSKEKQKLADEQCSRDVERLKSLYERCIRTKDNILTLLLSTLRRLHKLEEEAVIVNEIKQDVEELKSNVSEGRLERDAESMRQVLQTGVNIAATATTIAVTLSSLLQRRWEMYHKARTSTIPSIPDSERVLFEAKWSNIWGPLVGAKSGNDDVRKYNKQESQLDWSLQTLSNLRHSTPADEEVSRRKQIELAIHGNSNVPTNGSNSHLDKE